MNTFDEERAKMINDYLASLEKKIENKKRIINKLELLSKKLHKEKQALMEDMKQKAEAKDDDAGSMLKLKIKIWDLNDDIVRIRKKASNKAKGIIDKEWLLEAAKVAARDNLFFGPSYYVTPISDTDFEVSDAEDLKEDSLESEPDKDPYLKLKICELRAYSLKTKLNEMLSAKNDETESHPPESKLLPIDMLMELIGGGAVETETIEPSIKDIQEALQKLEIERRIHEIAVAGRRDNKKIDEDGGEEFVQEEMF